MEPFLFQLSGDPGEEALDLLLLFISVGEDEVVRADRHAPLVGKYRRQLPLAHVSAGQQIALEDHAIPILAASMLIYDRSKLKMKFLCQPRTLCHDSQLLQLIKVLSEWIRSQASRSSTACTGWLAK